MATLKELSYMLDANTKGLTDAVPAIARLQKTLAALDKSVNLLNQSITSGSIKSGKALKDQAAQVTKTSKVIEDGAKRQQAALLLAKQRQENLNQAIMAADGPTKMIRQLETAYKKLEKELTKSSTTTDKAKLAKAQYSATLMETSRNLRTYKQDVEASKKAEAATVAAKQTQKIARVSTKSSVKEQMAEEARAAKQAAEQLKKQQGALLVAKQRQENLNQSIRAAGAPIGILGQLTRSYNALEKALLADNVTSAKAALAKSKYTASLMSAARQLRIYKQEVDAAKKAEDAKNKAMGKPAGSGADVAAREAKRIKDLQASIAATMISADSKAKLLTNQMKKFGETAPMVSKVSAATEKLHDALQRAGSDKGLQNIAKATYRSEITSITAAFQDQVKAAKEAERAAKAALKGTGGTDAQKQQKALEDQAYRTSTALLGAKTRMDALNKAIAESGGKKELIEQNRAAFQRLSEQLLAAGNSSAKAQNSMAKFNATLASSKLRAKEANLSTFSGQLRELASVSVLAVGPLSGLGARLTALSGLFTRSTALIAGLVAGMVGLSVGTYTLASGALKTAFALDAMNAKLSIGSGSAAAAQHNYQMLHDMADQLGLDFIALASQFGKFSTAAQGTGLEGVKTARVFETIAATAARLRLTTEETSGIFKAFEQMISKGTVQAEELRGQLGDRLYGAFNLAARAMGVTTMELGKMMKKGEVVTDKFLPLMAAEMEKTFGVKAGERIESLQATQNRFNNVILDFNDAFNKTFRISELYQNSLTSLTGFIKNVAANMQELSAAAAAVSVGFVVLSSSQILSFLAYVAKGLKTATIAMLGLNAAMSLSPVGIILRLGAAIAAAAGAWVYFKQGVSDSKSSFNDLKTRVQEYLTKQKEGITLQQDVTDSLLSETVSRIGIIKEEIKVLQERNNAASAKELQKQADAENKINRGGLYKPPKYMPPIGSDSFGNLNPSSLDGGIKVFDTGMPTIYNEPKKTVESIKKELDTKVENAKSSLKSLEDLQAKLLDVRKKQDEAQKKRDNASTATEATDKQVREAARRKEAISEAQDAIAKAKREFAMGFMEPNAAAEQARMQTTIDNVDKFKDALVKAKVPQEQVNALTKQYNEILLETDKNFKVFERIADLFSLIRDSITDAITSTTDSLVDLALTGKASITDFRASFRQMAADIVKQLLKILVFKPLIDSLMGGIGGSVGAPINLLANPLPSAKGNVFNGSGVVPFRKGGVVNKPTMFGFGGGGVGKMSEMGSEAVMPLMRDGAGRLGVRATGGGTASNVTLSPIIKVVDQNNSKVSQRTYQEGGQDIVELLISPVSKMINSGRLDGALAARTSGSPRGIKRGSGG